MNVFTFLLCAVRLQSQPKAKLDSIWPTEALGTRDNASPLMVRRGRTRAAEPGFEGIFLFRCLGLRGKVIRQLLESCAKGSPENGRKEKQSNPLGVSMRRGRFAFDYLMPNLFD